MENQHRKISGYRELTQEEIDLMNEIKEKGKELGILIEKIKTTVQADSGIDVWNNPNRWLSIGQTDLQTGLMALTRAVARPQFF